MRSGVCTQSPDTQGRWVFWGDKELSAWRKVPNSTPTSWIPACQSPSPEGTATTAAGRPQPNFRTRKAQAFSLRLTTHSTTPLETLEKSCCWPWAWRRRPGSEAATGLPTDSILRHTWGAGASSAPHPPDLHFRADLAASSPASVTGAGRTDRHLCSAAPSPLCPVRPSEDKVCGPLALPHGAEGRGHRWGALPGSRLCLPASGTHRHSPPSAQLVQGPRTGPGTHASGATLPHRGVPFLSRWDFHAQANTASQSSRSK